jgi:hypothetical protein
VKETGCVFIYRERFGNSNDVNISALTTLSKFCTCFLFTFVDFDMYLIIN